MATVTDYPDESGKGELARAIRTRRSDCCPGEAAREILTYESPGHVHLVGIDQQAEKVIFYSCDRKEVIFVRFGSDGLADGGPCMGSFEKGPGFEAWIEKMDVYWGWLHPRFR